MLTKVSAIKFHLNSRSIPFSVSLKLTPQPSRSVMKVLILIIVASLLAAADCLPIPLPTGIKDAIVDAAEVFSIFQEIHLWIIEYAVDLLKKAASREL